MTERVTVGNLRVAKMLHDFVNDEAVPGTDLDPDSFWAGSSRDSTTTEVLLAIETTLVCLDARSPLERPQGTN